MRDRLPRIRHTGLEVKQMTRALAFWERQVGLTLIGVAEEQWNGRWLKIARLRDEGGAVLELVEATWPSHVAVGVKNFPKSWDGETAKPVKRGRLEVWFGRDPDGNRVELVKEGR